MDELIAMDTVSDPPLFFWLWHFNDFVNQTGLGDEVPFNEKLASFLKVQVFKDLYEKEIILDDEGNIVTSRGYYFMDNASFEQLMLEASLINAPQLLKEGQEVDILLHQETGKPLSCELPPFVALSVVYTEPGYKGDTATKTLKPATLETGLQIQVPLFINNADTIKVDTRTSTYAERIKK